MLTGGGKMDEMSGTDPKVIGGIRLFRSLGSGGFGRVYLGWDAFGQLVAVKVIRPILVSPQGLQLFAREARTMARLNSPFLVSLREISISNSPPFIVSDYIPGPTLQEGVHTPGGITPSEARAIALGLAKAISTLAAAGITHRDLKPANVILGPSGPVLVDLGIARGEEDTLVANIDEVAGTPAWMAPEQAHGGHASPASDVWAWGKVITWLADRSVPRGLDESIWTLAGAALAADPSSRPTAAQIVDELARSQPEEEVAAYWGRLGGYAAGRQDAVIEEATRQQTLLNQDGEGPTQVIHVAREGVSTLRAPSTAPPTSSAETSKSSSQGPIIAAIVVTGLIVAAAIVAAVMLLRPQSSASAPAPAASVPGVTITVAPAPQPTSTTIISVSPGPTVTATIDQYPSGPAWSSEELNFLCPSQPDLLPPLIGPESDAQGTKVIQKLLTYVYLEDPGPIDGEYGPQTISAVTRLQRQLGVFPDGQVGPITWGALQADLCLFD